MQGRDLKEAGLDSKKILNRLKNRDFSGENGQAIKNSTWQLSTNIIAKVGSLIFTIILSRMLGAEVYGLYGLALSTILFLGLISDLGLSTTLTTFISKTIDKNPKKAKGYYSYLTKIKFILVGITSLILIVCAKWVATSYYNKPIFYAILAGAIYLPLSSLFQWFSSIFVSINKFRHVFTKEVIFQTVRLTFVPLFIVLAFNKIKTEIFLFWIFAIVGIAYFIGAIFILVKLKKNKIIISQSKENLTGKEVSDLKRFALPLSITALSGSFFGYIDTVMLGRFVSSEFIAFYQNAFNLITAASTILAFMGIALLPIFSRVDEEKSIKLFRKSRLILFLISVCAVIFTLLVSKYLILLIYGQEYLQSVLYLRFFSILLIFSPMTELYVNYYTSQKKTNIIAWSLVISTILNVILNSIFIRIGLTYGMAQAVLGACIATIISKFAYLGILGVGRKIFIKK